MWKIGFVSHWGNGISWPMETGPYGSAWELSFAGQYGKQDLRAKMETRAWEPVQKLDLTGTVASHGGNDRNCGYNGKFGYKSSAPPRRPTFQSDHSLSCSPFLSSLSSLSIWNLRGGSVPACLRRRLSLPASFVSKPFCFRVSTPIS
ncbi:hypothetical protein LR48_Vigan04g187200 [Vigna angularis]|uniref:Uncharacterized protein n=1 Tax=Phaseolus angularis TaxID=3914 RepID=A0A0L9UGJ1_PHAAN|nr:hypothetical protein LR48_Vigan04g187200 [Vigna angularis]